MFSIHLWPLKDSNGVLLSLPSTLKRVPKMSQREQYYWVPSGRKVLTLYRMSYGISFKLYDDMMTSCILGMIWSIMRPIQYYLMFLRSSTTSKYQPRFTPGQICHSTSISLSTTMVYPKWYPSRHVIWETIWNFAKDGCIKCLFTRHFHGTQTSVFLVLR